MDYISEMEETRKKLENFKNNEAEIMKNLSAAERESQDLSTRLHKLRKNFLISLGLGIINRNPREPIFPEIYYLVWLESNEYGYLPPHRDFDRGNSVAEFSTYEEAFRTVVNNLEYFKKEKEKRDDGKSV